MIERRDPHAHEAWGQWEELCMAFDVMRGIHRHEAVAHYGALLFFEGIYDLKPGSGQLLCLSEAFWNILRSCKFNCLRRHILKLLVNGLALAA